jgi:hypothetical protein
VIPAVIYRLRRCNADDVTALNFFFRTSFAITDSARNIRSDPVFSSFSRVIQVHIVQSEEWLALNEAEVDAERISAWHQSTIIAPSFLKDDISLRARWPKYSVDQYRYRVASYSPLLMISGQLDPATPFDQLPQLAAITSKTRTFYGIPLAGHVTISMALAGYLCPLHLIVSWAFPNVFPAEWSDPKCIGELPTTIDFVGATEHGRRYSMKYFNTSQPFGNGSFSPIPSSSAADLTDTFQLSNLWCLLVWSLFSALFI